MACVHPITAWSLKHQRPRRLVFQQPRGLESAFYEELKIPCGQCIGCRLDYSRDWATRITHEASLWSDNWFVTLTYAPVAEPLLMHRTVNTETGEVFEGLSLQPSHMTKFMKDLRAWFKYHRGADNIRFYLCGEYGSLYDRPHYHLAIFNLPLEDADLIFFRNNECGDALYRCPILENIWSFDDGSGKKIPYGFVSVGSLTWQSAAYIARYMLKKQKGKSAEWYYGTKGIIPEFTRCSRRPGIGRDYFEARKDEIYKYDHCVVPHRTGPMLTKPPKYYDRLYDVYDHETLEQIKAHRQEVALNQQAVMLSRTSLTLDEINENKERRLQDSARALVRNIEKG